MKFLISTYRCGSCGCRTTANRSRCPGCGGRLEAVADESEMTRVQVATSGEVESRPVDTKRIDSEDRPIMRARTPAEKETARRQRDETIADLRSIAVREIE